MQVTVFIVLVVASRHIHILVHISKQISINQSIISIPSIIHSRSSYVHHHQSSSLILPRNSYHHHHHPHHHPHPQHS
ncbi:hypothetical protein BDQ94DRAFT_152170 [Aspergillus welwitschiae]|uniref:Uncharacterized protein n=1 Tax=Aspergillus welwitschiae TaxID=1341132 RepID=A0A3F3PND1_9EURO|nr:hypothetical protein BDQ94DRAFT_152170 [Aspergillus welwitschiae]RDH28338.1 hypothetical protein BDQ94DRAFT_152170 [Aspergillus welwitschiae]